MVKNISTCKLVKTWLSLRFKSVALAMCGAGHYGSRDEQDMGPAPEQLVVQQGEEHPWR